MGSAQDAARHNQSEKHNAPGKRMTQTEWHKVQLERLLANPEKAVILPSGPEKPKEIRPPKEMILNVQGSSSGAGSGEFHVYKQNRRREYERLKLMDEEIKAEEERAAFLARQKERDDLAEAKTSKNRAKRMKAKRKRGGADKLDESEERKKKLGGAAVTFKKPGEAGEDDDEESEEEKKVSLRQVETKEDQEPEIPTPAAPVAVVQSKAIVIHDDE